MKPEDKAKELVNKFFPDLKSITEMGFSHGRKEYAIKCALICVDEMIEEIRIIEFGRTSNLYDSIEFWNEVKQEMKELKKDLEKFSIHQIKNNASDKI